MAKLNFRLHERYPRREAYVSLGVEFSQQNRNQIKGLSPRLPDGGYFIFVTHDKDNFDPAYDYDDRLFTDLLHCVTRRGVDENGQDYRNLQDRRTRVSLFVSNRERVGLLGDARHPK